MNRFDLPGEEGRPSGIADFEIHLQTSPPEITEKIIYGVEKYIKKNKGENTLVYSDASLQEGHLNIFICHFKTGKCRLHIFGQLRGEKIHVEREIFNPCSKSIKVLNEKIRFVLLQSRNILQAYYASSNLESLRNHLLDFFVPLGKSAAQA